MVVVVKCFVFKEDTLKKLQRECFNISSMIMIFDDFVLNIIFQVKEVSLCLQSLLN